jgi:IclR family transcriptional regulator, KDG regulon repressor
MGETNCDPESETADRPPVSIVEKAVELLAAFGPAHAVCGVSELARRSGLPKSTAHRLLGTLIRSGMVERYGEGYRSGDRLRDMADRLHYRHRGLREILLPFVADAYGMTRKTVQLGLLHDRTVANIEVLREPNALSRDQWDAERCPLHCSAIGLVLLAHAPQAVCREVLNGELRAFTPGTITSPARLASELDRIRRRGYAYFDQGYAAGVRAAAVPIFACAGTVVAGLAVVGRADDFEPHAMIEAVTRVGRKASAALQARARPVNAMLAEPARPWHVTANTLAARRACA